MSSGCPRCGYSEVPARRTWTLVIPLDTVTQNHVSGTNAGRGRFRYKFQRDMIQGHVARERKRLRIPKAKRLRRIRIVRHYGEHSQLRDRGNFVGGCKALLDSLVREGLLVDDAEEWVDDYYEQRRLDEGKTYIEVVIEELAK